MGGYECEKCVNPHGNVSRREDCLHDDDWNLDAEAKASTGKDLIADPFRGGNLAPKGRDETAADGHQHARGDEPWGEVAEESDASTTDDTENGRAEDQWERVDAALGGRDAPDALEPDWNVIHKGEE